ncbi:MAG: cupin domain-containing protein [Rhodospirillales bacterium]|nr:cupin domain-containing protein [Rhodospirillales bacterium]
MLPRRGFLGCAICAAGGLAATAAAAQGSAPAAPGFKRTELSRLDGPTAGYVTLVVQIDAQPHAVIARHTHPGIESGRLETGGGTITVDGQPTRTLAPGDVFQVPAGVPHMMTAGAGGMQVISVYVVERDKPLATPA